MPNCRAGLDRGWPWCSLLGWPLPYEFDVSKTGKPGQVIAELDQVFYKNVGAEQREEWQGDDVNKNSYEGFHHILHPIARMPVKLTAKHKGALQQVT